MENQLPRLGHRGGYSLRFQRPGTDTKNGFAASVFFSYDKHSDDQDGLSAEILLVGSQS